MACLDDNALGRELTHAEHAHVAECSQCREILAAVLQSSATEDATRGDEPSAVLAPGAALGRFRVEALHGVGGMGVVYAATDTTLGRRVALKLLRAGSSGRAREQLLAEARALAKLTHPAVVAVHDVELEGDRIYLAMEWVEGETLRDWLARTRRSRGALLDAFDAAGRGLAAIHAAGLVHGDFKPANVLVGHDGRVRVADLGSGETPAYAAPERERSARADQYSFCVSLVEALTGDRKGRSTLPGHLSAPLVRGLEADPARRFESMEALLAALARARGAPVRRALAGAALLLVLAAAAWAARPIDGDSLERQCLDAALEEQRAGVAPRVPAESCVRVATLRARVMASGAAPALERRGIYAERARARALLAGGEPERAFVQAWSAYGRATASGDSALAVETLVMVAEIEEETGRLDAAAEHLRQAGSMAEALRHEEAAVMAWCGLVRIVGVRQGKIDVARNFAGLAEAALVRAGDVPELAACVRDAQRELERLKGPE